MPNDSRPVPDPTKLTTDQLYREIGALHSLIETRLNGRDNLTDERLESAKEAIRKAEQLAAAEHANLNTKISGLKERLDRGDGRISGQTAIVASMIAIATLILGLLVYLKP